MFGVEILLLKWCIIYFVGNKKMYSFNNMLFVFINVLILNIILYLILYDFLN